jgi:hypothetical protein
VSRIRDSFEKVPGRIQARGAGGPFFFACAWPKSLGGDCPNGRSVELQVLVVKV